MKILQYKEKQMSWKNLADLIHDSCARMVLSVGDILEFELKDGTPVRIDVAGIDTYNDNEVIFCFHDVYWKHSMNTNDTNRGGYAESEMAIYLDDEIFPMLPDELQAVIKPRAIHQTVTDYARNCMLWLPSIYEVAGEEYAEYNTDVNDKHLELFQNRRNRVKFGTDNYPHYWWERSPNISTSTNFMLVHSNGSANTNYASSTNGVVPCFSI